MFRSPPLGVKAIEATGMGMVREPIEAAEAATELYWGSDKSVNQIAEELDLSKSALYSMIRPLPSGLACTECGNEVVSPNRTAQERGILACPNCGWEGTEQDARALGGEGSVTIPEFDEVDHVDAPPPPRFGSRNRMMAGGALLGAAAGLALVFWARRRS